MKFFRDWQAWHDLVNRVPRVSNQYSTNLYADQAQLARWGEKGRLRVEAIEGAVLLLRRDRDFDHVYHVARDLPALQQALEALPPGRYAADLIGRDDARHHDLCSAYRAAGFDPRTHLRRMIRKRAAFSLPQGNTAVATMADVKCIAAFLDRLLDRFVEQVPEPDELHEAVSGERLLLVRGSSGPTGVLMYDLTGQLAHLRFWHVDPQSRGAGIGRRLMADFLSRCRAAARTVLWVIGDNERSIAIYRHYGFEMDSLLDHIMVRNEDQRR
ncbi:GNAT family N-acetyltransferase [Sphingomonas sp. BK580]|uniref:GNAT family N-acetyltransferase n=1 Tax=Sphingomonas sp. BK580 TaxID=2586972 RepID=UPI001612ADB2|nr:GNAT family N-acetyltransferase [Sphingomonas sp. BK580]MBB3693776.1 ribosomal protein S18 acetylase RimI-like enzyme [Sphingomonas sp. BK580]